MFKDLRVLLRPERLCDSILGTYMGANESVELSNYAGSTQIHACYRTLSLFASLPLTVVYP